MENWNFGRDEKAEGTRYEDNERDFLSRTVFLNALDEQIQNLCIFKFIWNLMRDLATNKISEQERKSVFREFDSLRRRPLLRKIW